MASCHGGFISKEEAKIRIDYLNLLINDSESESYIPIEEYDLDNYELKHNSNDGITYREIKELYNKKERYYHRYVFTIYNENGEEKRSLIESWKYYLEEDGKHIIYNVTRTDGKSSDLGNPVYVVSRDIYKNEDNFKANWQIFIDTLRDNNRLYVSNAINDLDDTYNKIVEDNNIMVSYLFNSLGSDSVYMKANYDENNIHHDMEIDVEYHHLKSYYHRTSEVNFDDIHINYNVRIDKLTPNITNEESKPYEDIERD